MTELKYDNLVGKAFLLGKQDCFTTVIDFFKQNFDIDIPAFSRPSNWNADELDLITLLYKKTGFEKIDIETWDPRPGDVMATAIGSSNPNHLVIYVGDNKILQHKMGVFSSVDPFRPVWRTFTCFVLRHPDVPDLRPVYPDVTITDILKARFQHKTV